MQAPTIGTREEWLNKAALLLKPALHRVGATVPDRVRFSLSMMRKRRTVGLCFDPSVSGDASWEILIKLDREDALDVLAILAHELIHASLGVRLGHGSRFRGVAVALGLVGPMRATLPGPSFKVLAAPLLLALGSFPHRALNVDEHPLERKQRARQLPLFCPTCKLRIWTTRSAMAAVDLAGMSWLCPIDGQRLQEGSKS
jgi:hypothetical protein